MIKWLISNVDMRSKKRKTALSFGNIFLQYTIKNGSRLLMYNIIFQNSTIWNSVINLNLIQYDIQFNKISIIQQLYNL